MYVCIYVCIYIYMYVCMYECMYVCVFMFLTINNQNLHSPHGMIFKMDTHCALCEVRAEILHTKQTIFRCQTVNTNTILVIFF